MRRIVTRRVACDRRQHRRRAAGGARLKQVADAGDAEQAGVSRPRVSVAETAERILILKPEAVMQGQPRAQFPTVLREHSKLAHAQAVHRSKRAVRLILLAQYN